MLELTFFEIGIGIVLFFLGYMVGKKSKGRVINAGGGVNTGIIAGGDVFGKGGKQIK